MILIGNRLSHSIAVIFISTTVLLSNPAAASSTNQDSWSGSGEFGASLTTGNTKTTSANGKLKLKYKSGRWSQRLALSALQASENGNSTANRTVGELSTQYDFDGRDYAFGSLRGSHDTFSGYSYQASVAAGLGRKLWVSQKSDLTAEFGPGYRRSKLVNGQTENNLIGRANIRFKYKISGTTSFTQAVTVLSGAANTEIDSESGFSVSVTKTLAMKVAYTAQHNSRVPVGAKKTDTFTSVNLVYAFGDK